ncbi:25087_t:CDS:2, partial [Gigaspora margarita]
STMDSANDDNLDTSDNGKEKNSNDDEEVLASTSISTNFNAIIYTPDNLKEEVKKVQYLFNGCDTEYVWLGSTSNLINHFRDIYYITKESLANKSVKVHQQTIQQ